jgi:hypothetical protein
MHIFKVLIFFKIIERINIYLLTKILFLDSILLFFPSNAFCYLIFYFSNVYLYLSNFIFESAIVNPI